MITLFAPFGHNMSNFSDFIYNRKDFGKLKKLKMSLSPLYEKQHSLKKIGNAKTVPFSFHFSTNRTAQIQKVFLQP